VRCSVAKAGIRHTIDRHRAGAGLGVVATLGFFLAGCAPLGNATQGIGNLFGGGPAPGTPGYVHGFVGGVVADEPRAALVGRDVLAAGGNAADAAVAAGLMMAVTLPSRAGLGGGGACLAYDPAKSGPGGGKPEAVLFLPGPGGGGGARPAAVPMLARGLYALHARYGRLPFATLIGYAEQAARLGTPVSRAFERDLTLVAQPLAADPQARSIFFTPDGKPLAEGALLRQPALAATLSQLRVAGVGDLYVGTLARKFASAADAAGGGVTLAALRAGLPRFAPPLLIPAPGDDEVAFLPPPADGGLAAAAAFQSLSAHPGDLAAAGQRAEAVAAAWRATGGHGDAEALLRAPPSVAATLPALPASAGLVALDRDGEAVSCAFTMNNLFGTGRVAPGTGVLLAASPDWMPPPLLAAAIAWNPNIRAFHAAVVGTGQQAAPLAAADLLAQELHAARPMVFGAPAAGANAPPSTLQSKELPVTTTLVPPPDPGRADVIGCAGYLPGSRESCIWAADPRDSGLAIGGS
jgi:gamma-glutamyltranspeptidase/glutathione hydrolase